MASVTMLDKARPSIKQAISRRVGDDERQPKMILELPTHLPTHERIFGA
jgi:hypothetical protein